jgi:hypothetical protein
MKNIILIIRICVPSVDECSTYHGINRASASNHTVGRASKHAYVIRASASDNIFARETNGW